MAIHNNICEACDHRFVCEKLKILSKFDDSNKSFIRMDITIDECQDFLNTDTEDGDED